MEKNKPTIKEITEEVSARTKTLKENKKSMSTKEINDEVRRISQLIQELFN